IKRSVSVILSPIYLLSNLPSQLYTWVNEQGKSKQFLLNQNKLLSAELFNLKVDLQNHNTLLLENQKLAKLMESRYKLSKDVFILARVGSIRQSRLKKQITVSKGDGDGIKIGQVVLGSEGVLGQVNQVTPFYSTILLITDPTQHIPVKSQRTGTRGISKGIASKHGKLVVRFIEAQNDVKVGDVFVTSAIGSKFPAGYPVGRVTHTETSVDETFLYIEMEPIQIIQQLEFVLINKKAK
ncbi:MAG: rod shape-determining protein MreC, partial [Candidatus Thioglobus sp.]